MTFSDLGLCLFQRGLVSVKYKYINIYIYIYINIYILLYVWSIDSLGFFHKYFRVRVDIEPEQKFLIVVLLRIYS